MKSLSLGSNTVKYIEVGSGEPMLFLHNGGSGHWVWHYQIHYFSKKYRVFAFDMLGCGASDRPNVAYDLNFYSQMTNDILVQLNLHNVILVGNCVGAAAALEYASQDSSRLKTLVLFNLCGGHDMMTPLVRWASLPLPKSLEPMHRLALKILEYTPGVLASAVRTNYASMPDPTDPVFLAETKEAHNPAQTESRLNLKKGLSSFNKFSHNFVRPSNLPPIMVFWGQQNHVLPLSNGLRFCKRLQPMQTHIVENAGHLLMAEKPNLVNLYIDKFLSSLDEYTGHTSSSELERLQTSSTSEN